MWFLLLQHAFRRINRLVWHANSACYLRIPHLPHLQCCRKQGAVPFDFAYHDSRSLWVASFDFHTETTVAAYRMDVNLYSCLPGILFDLTDLFILESGQLLLGNTRIVIGEKGNKQVVAVDDEGFDPRSIPLQRWDDYATANNLPGSRRIGVEKMHDLPYEDMYEMDDMKSMYSAVKPASTILTGFPARNSQAFMPPQSPAAFGTPNRQSVYSTGPYMDQPTATRQQSVMSPGGGLQDFRTQSPYQDYPQPQSNRPSMINPTHSMDNLLSPTPPPNNGIAPSSRLSHMQSRTSVGYSGGARQPYSQGAEAQLSTFDFQRGNQGPDDNMIVEAIQNCLREVDLDSVTKKQVRALVEQRLQTELVGERRTFLDRMIDSELANM